MTAESIQPPMLHTSEKAFPLHQYHLHLAGRQWVVLHTGVILTPDDEAQFFRELMTQIPYGVALWPSAIALAFELADRGDALQGKSILELGAGTGLPGIVAASLGGKVVQTDRQEMAMSVCIRNGEENHIAGIDHRLVDWLEWHDDTKYDLILGSDILYWEPLHTSLTHIFQTNLAPGGRILLADPFRGVSLRLLESLETQGWHIAITKWTVGDTNPRAIGVFELTPPA